MVLVAMHDDASPLATISNQSVPCGRFAPSPSGPLHFGSLVAALGSFMMARSEGGRWLLRIEDIDTPRVVPGAADAILHTLEAFGLCWDGPVTYQSHRLPYYKDALSRLLAAGLAYPCSCSRQEVARTATKPLGTLVYPGTCRHGPLRLDQLTAIRLRTDARIICFHDLLQGFYSQCLETAVGDFLIRRADGLFTYQLAVVVDDAAQGITQVVRGSDLLESTPRQIYLQHLLGLPTPGYHHLLVAVDRFGYKLSKQTQAEPVNYRQPAPSLLAALRFLGQNPPPELAATRLDEVWSWALANWRPERIPALTTLGWTQTPRLESAPATTVTKDF